MCALHEEGWYWGEGALGSQSPNRRQPGLSVGRPSIHKPGFRSSSHTDWRPRQALPAGPGEKTPPHQPPTPAWPAGIEDPSQSTESLGPRSGLGPSQKGSTLIRPLGKGQDFPELRLGGGTGVSVRRDPVDLLHSVLPPLPPMGNNHCVPQAPRRLRASFSRKPSLKGNREDGARKLAGLLGTEAGPDLDTTADKIFYYIPGPVSRRVARPSSQGAAAVVSVGLRVPVLAFQGPGSSLSAWGESVQNQVRKETPPRPGELPWRKA